MMYGHKRAMIAGAIAMIVAVVAMYIRPFIISFTVDYVIGGIEETDIPQTVMNWIESIGGRDYMISHFILCAVALVFVTFINAAATHFGEDLWQIIRRNG